MSDLITRLEALTGPCRECDYLISAEVFGSRAQWRMPRQYTSSIDAAMTLVPEGWHIHEANFGDPDCPPMLAKPYFLLLPNRNNNDGWTQPDRSRDGAQAATPAIALCIAALKATP